MEVRYRIKFDLYAPNLRPFWVGADKLTDAIRAAKAIRAGRTAHYVSIERRKHGKWTGILWICDNCHEVFSDFGEGCCWPE
jgi:hypothetical protein